MVGIVALTAAVTPAVGATEDVAPPELLGRCTVEQLDEEPFSEWFRGGYDEYTPNAAVLRPDTYKSILSGGTAYVFGDPRTPHTYSFTPDVARGLATLGTDSRAVGRAWHLPAAAQLTTIELMERFAARAGTQVKVRRVPAWALRGLGVVVPLLGAMATMNYQWDVPYRIDDGDFRRTFGVEATDLDEAIDTTLDAYRVAKAA